MPRLIDADALKSYIDDEISMSREEREDADAKEDVLGMAHTNGEIQEARRIKRYIEKHAPTIDAEPVRHGRWVWHEDWGHPSISEPPELLDAYWICSVCGTDLLQYLKSHFPDIPSYTECSEEVPTLERCPHCGAKMDGGKDNDCK